MPSSCGAEACRRPCDEEQQIVPHAVERDNRGAEAKRNKLRLVLASLYYELVGSSDKVLYMQKRAGELDGLVQVLPGLVEKLVWCAERAIEESGVAIATTMRASLSLPAGSRVANAMRQGMTAKKRPRRTKFRRNGD